MLQQTLYIRNSTNIERKEVLLMGQDVNIKSGNQTHNLTIHTLFLITDETDYLHTELVVLTSNVCWEYLAYATLTMHMHTLHHYI